MLGSMYIFDLKYLIHSPSMYISNLKYLIHSPSKSYVRFYVYIRFKVLDTYYIAHINHMLGSMYMSDLKYLIHSPSMYIFDLKYLIHSPSTSYVRFYVYIRFKVLDT